MMILICLVCLQCVKSKSTTNLAELATDGASLLDAAGQALLPLSATEGPLGPVVVGLGELALNGVQAQAQAGLDIDAIETSGQDADELGAVGGVDVYAPRRPPYAD